MPPLAILPALISAGTGIAGAVEGAKTAGAQRKALNIQDQIAQQEMADKQQAFKQLMDFFGPYLQNGSPFLQMIQRAAAEQNATGANNAAGMVRSNVERSGMGFGPSGTEAAALGGLGAETARTGATNYLENLLNNEQLKFQAASGIKEAGSMVGSPQNQPNVSVNMPAASAGSSFGALGQVLQNLLKSGGGGINTGNIGGVDLSTPGIIGSGAPIGPNLPPVPTSPATTGGWSI